MAWSGGSLATLTEILEVNWIILYFVYGQVFFVMGLVTGLQWRRSSQLPLARPLPWLAAFGIAHGLNEWGYIFIPLQALYLPDAVVRLLVISHLLLLAVSFFFLFQFGVELLLPLLPKQRWLRALPAVTLLSWAAGVFLRGILFRDPLNVLAVIGDGWSRYLLSFPGSLLACGGLVYHARQVRQRGFPRISLYLTGAAVAFGIYALVGGLVAPTAPIFPANRLNYALIQQTMHVPVQVIRSLCGLSMALLVTRSLQIFQAEDERRITQMEQAQILAADRERIGRELHDGIIQRIYAAGLGLEEAHLLVLETPLQAQKRMRSVMEVLNQTIHDIRRYIFDLRVAEQTQELERVLASLVEDLRLDTLLEADLEVIGQRCCWLRPSQVSQVTQIAREALSNVVQHAQATHVEVRLVYEGDYTRLVIKDNGRGVDLGSLREGAYEGQGLTNMRTRASLIGAELAVRSQPGEGFALELTIPCPTRKGEEAPITEQQAWA
jgi:signal transduction histidine kinase